MRDTEGFILIMALIFNSLMLILLLASYQVTLSVLKEHHAYLAYLNEIMKKEVNPDEDPGSDDA